MFISLYFPISVSIYIFWKNLFATSVKKGKNIRSIERRKLHKKSNILKLLEKGVYILQIPPEDHNMFSSSFCTVASGLSENRHTNYYRRIKCVDNNPTAASPLKFSMLADNINQNLLWISKHCRRARKIIRWPNDTWNSQLSKYIFQICWIYKHCRS